MKDLHTDEVMGDINIKNAFTENIIKDALQNSNFSVEVVEVSFESSLESAKVSNFWDIGAIQCILDTPRPKS